MKLMKKLLTVFIAFILAFAVFAISACDDLLPDNGDTPSIDKPDDGDKDPVTPENPDGGDKDPVTPENPDGDDNDPVTPENPDESDTTEDTVISNALKDEKKYADITGSMAAEDNRVTYAIAENGLLGELISTELYMEGGYDVEGKVNFQTGNGDAKLISTYKNDEYDSEETDLFYLRDYELFVSNVTYSEDIYHKGSVTDFFRLNYGDMIPADTTDSELNDFISLLFKNTFTYQAYVELRLAEAYGVLSIDDGKATVDLNKLIYDMLVDIQSCLENIDEATTVREILNDETVKKILTPFTEVLSADEMRDILIKLYEYSDFATFLEQNNIELDINDVLVTPADGEDSYAYLLRAISSEKAKEAFDSVYKAAVDPQFEGLPLTLDKISINFIMEMLGYGEDAFISMRDEYLELISYIVENSSQEFILIEETYDYDFDEYDEVSGGLIKKIRSYYHSEKFENGRIEFILDGNKIISQNISVDWTMMEVRHNDDEEYWSGDCCVYNNQLNIIYADEAFDLEDINDRTVLNTEYRYVEETKECDLHVYVGEYWYDSYNCEFIYNFKIQSVIEDDTVVDFIIYDKDGNLLEYTDMAGGKSVTIIEQYNDNELSFNVKFYFNGNDVYVSCEGYVNVDNSELCYWGYGNSVYFGSTLFVYENTVQGVLNGDPFVLQEN